MKSVAVVAIVLLAMAVVIDAQAAQPPEAELDTMALVEQDPVGVVVDAPGGDILLPGAYGGYGYGLAAGYGYAEAEEIPAVVTTARTAAAIPVIQTPPAPQGSAGHSVVGIASLAMAAAVAVVAMF